MWHGRNVAEQSWTRGISREDEGDEDEDENEDNTRASADEDEEEDENAEEGIVDDMSTTRTRTS